MSRPLREQEPGVTYHVTTHAVSGTKLMRRDSDRRRFLNELAVVVARYEWRCLAVALLDNHYHLLVQITKPNLARGMQRLNGGYAASFNQRYGRKGHLFGARYYSGAIVSDAHFLWTVRYIARNRTAANAAKHPASDVWSSYPGVVGKSACWPFVARAHLLAALGPEPLALAILEELVESPANADVRLPGVRPP